VQVLPRASVAAHATVLTATDRLTIGFLSVLAVLAAARHPSPLPLLFAIGGLGAGIVLSARWGAVSRAGRIVHDFFPVMSVIAIFTLTGPVIAATNPLRGDPTFAALDLRLFGAFPARWFDALGRPAWLTDVASLTYVTYYFVPVVMAVALYVRDRQARFEELVFTTVTAFFASYTSYFVLPTSGPRVPLELEATVLGGGAVSAAIREILRHIEANQLDAFPSGHVTLSLVFLVYGWKDFPRWRVPLTAVTAGIVFSTVYLSYHYVIDLVAGALLASTLPLVVPLLRRAVGSANGPPPPLRQVG
jgi:membrane-associated phospholipid phosphatase